LLVFSKIEFQKEDIEIVAEAIIKFTAKTPDPKLTFDDYIRLITIKVGLNEMDIETIRNIILASPLKYEINKALESNEIGQADDTANKIFSNQSFVDTVMEGRKDKERIREMAALLHKKDQEIIKEKAAREELERVSNPNIIITTNVSINIDMTVRNEIKPLIDFLENENAFKNGKLEIPKDLSTIEKTKTWLETIKKAIEISKEIGEGIKQLLPYITYLIIKYGGN
jgi:hypothetical protein